MSGQVEGEHADFVERAIRAVSKSLKAAHIGEKGMY